jgi:uncharacterized protein with PIN domain
LPDVRCLKCQKKLAEVNEKGYDVKDGDVSFDDHRVYQTCGKCRERYEVKRQGMGWALIGEKGSKIFE